MHIELIGCTGAGKSTIARQLVAAGRRQGTEILTEQEFILRCFWLNWLLGKRVRTCAVNLLAVSASCIYWRANRPFGCFVLRTILRQRIGWLQKVYLARIALKKLGTDYIIRRRVSSQQIVVVDEGTLLIANNLFVDCNVKPDLDKLAEFADLVPVPDVVVYVKERKAVLVTRTLQRGHKRIPSRSPTQVQAFISGALEIFDRLTQHPAVRDRLWIVESTHEIRFSENPPPPNELTRMFQSLVPHG